MSSVTALLIAGACTGFSGTGNQACSKALEAGGLQSGFSQNINKAEGYVTTQANKKAKYIMGDTGMEIVGGTVFLAKTVRDKSVQFNLPTFGICDKIVNKVGTDQVSTTLEWRF